MGGHGGAMIVLGLLIALSFILHLQIWMQLTVLMLQPIINGYMIRIKMLVIVTVRVIRIGICLV